MMDRIIQSADLHHYGNDQRNRVCSPDGIAPTLKTVSGGGRQVKITVSDEQVRALTPREYFRLMGFDDRDFDVLIENHMSNTQLYKMAGNSIAVTMLEHLFEQLYPSTSKIDSLKKQSLAILQNL